MRPLPLIVSFPIFHRKKIMKPPTCILITVTATVIIRMCVDRATRHTLIIQSIQMQGVRASYAGILTGSAASPTTLVACFARLGGWFVVLRAQALNAQTLLQHKVSGTGIAR